MSSVCCRSGSRGDIIHIKKTSWRESVHEPPPSSHFFLRSPSSASYLYEPVISLFFSRQWRTTLHSDSFSRILGLKHLPSGLAALSCPLSSTNILCLDFWYGALSHSDSVGAFPRAGRVLLLEIFYYTSSPVRDHSWRCETQIQANNIKKLPTTSLTLAYA